MRCVKHKGIFLQGWFEVRVKLYLALPLRDNTPPFHQYSRKLYLWPASFLLGFQGVVSTNICAAQCVLSKLIEFYFWVFSLPLGGPRGAHAVCKIFNGILMNNQLNSRRNGRPESHRSSITQSFMTSGVPKDSQFEKKQHFI